MDSVGHVMTYTYVGLVPRKERLPLIEPPSASERPASRVCQMPLQTSFTVEGEPELDVVCGLPSYTETITTVYVHGRPREMSIHRRYHRSETKEE